MTRRIGMRGALLAATLALGGCLGDLTGAGGPTVRVGPSIDAAPNQTAVIPFEGIRIDVVVPVFEPGLPEDPDDYEDEGVWPELRRAEANRFAVNLRDSLRETATFGDVRVAPDTEVTGDLYVLGKIEESDGRDVAMVIEAIDITGQRLLKKRYKHRVKEQFWKDLRNEGLDPYQPVFDRAAADISELIRKKSSRELVAMRQVTELRFAGTFAGDAFADYLEIEDRTYTLVALPAPDDPMLERIRRLRVRDELFMDTMQAQYEGFTTRTDTSYAAWQEHSITEVRLREEAQGKALVQGILGAVLAIGGAYAAIKGGHEYDPGAQVGGAAALGVGGLLLAESDSNFAQIEVHSEALAELGESLDLEVAPQVVALEDSTVELTGDARAQYRQWRAFLKKFWDEHGVPSTQL